MRHLIVFDVKPQISRLSDVELSSFECGFCVFLILKSRFYDIEFPFFQC